MQLMMKAIRSMIAGLQNAINRLWAKQTEQGEQLKKVSAEIAKQKKYHIQIESDGSVTLSADLTFGKLSALSAEEIQKSVEVRSWHGGYKTYISYNLFDVRKIQISSGTIVYMTYLDWYNLDTYGMLRVIKWLQGSKPKAEPTTERTFFNFGYFEEQDKRIPLEFNLVTKDFSPRNDMYFGTPGYSDMTWFAAPMMKIGGKSKDDAAAKRVATLDDIRDVTLDGENTPQLGGEMLTGGNWSGAGWSGSVSGGLTHATGNDASLTIPVGDLEPGALYAVAFTVDGEVTTDNLKVRLGGSEPFELYGQAGGGNQTVVGLKAVDDSGLEFIPSATFVGSISEISVRRIEAAAEPMQMVQNADGTTIEETRRIGDSLYMGLNSGRYTLQDKRGLNGATGSGNLALGRGALANVTSGFWNTAIGKDALGENDVGSRNIAIGRNALMGNKTGHRNIAIGTYALVHNSSGHHNIAIGADAMDGNTSGYGNVGIGFGTLYTNTSGYGNTAIGASALNRSTSGYRNVAIGENALYSNTEQYNNVAVGFQAMSNLANKYSCNNVAIGNNAGMYLKTGGRNILIGADADIQDRTTGAGEWELNIGNLIRGKMSGRTAAPTTRYAIIDGGLQINDLPTSDPGIAGRLWNDGGTLKVSAG